MFMIPKDPNPYKLVIDHIKTIENTKCPVGKFEQMGKLKNMVCEVNILINIISVLIVIMNSIHILNFPLCKRR
jgi:hypothetical protein